MADDYMTLVHHLTCEKAGRPEVRRAPAPYGMYLGFFEPWAQHFVPCTREIAQKAINFLARTNDGWTYAIKSRENVFDPMRTGKELQVFYVEMTPPTAAVLTEFARREAVSRRFSDQESARIMSANSEAARERYRTIELEKEAFASAQRLRANLFYDRGVPPPDGSRR